MQVAGPDNLRFSAPGTEEFVEAEDVTRSDSEAPPGVTVITHKRIRVQDDLDDINGDEELVDHADTVHDNKNEQQSGEQDAGAAQYGGWTHNNVEVRGAPDVGASVSDLSHVQYRSPRELFLHFFPWEFIASTVVPTINERNASLNLTCGELQRFIGLLMVLAQHTGPRREFW